MPLVGVMNFKQRGTTKETKDTKTRRRKVQPQITQISQIGFTFRTAQSVNGSPPTPCRWRPAEKHSFQAACRFLLSCSIVIAIFMPVRSPLCHCDVGGCSFLFS